MLRDNTEPETITVNVPGTTQTIVDILQDQYGHLESGEARAKLEMLLSEVWTQSEFDALFDATGTTPPYVAVVRKQDGVAGTVMFVDSPRFYFSFNAGSEKDDGEQA